MTVLVICFFLYIFTFGACMVKNIEKWYKSSRCRDCGHAKDNSRFHFDAPGDNWGAALHWFKPPRKD